MNQVMVADGKYMVSLDSGLVYLCWAGSFVGIVPMKEAGALADAIKEVISKGETQ